MTTQDELDALKARRDHITAEIEQLELAMKKAGEPAPAPLKYKPGDVVLMPVRVMDVDEYEHYKVTPLHSLDKQTGYWVSRAALEPPAPRVGQKVIAWSDVRIGEMIADEDSDPVYPFRIRADDTELDWWQGNAVALE